jgi:ribosomal protein L27
MPTVWYKWFFDLYQLLTGRVGRQNFINTLTKSASNNEGANYFLISDSKGDVTFTGSDDPQIGPNGTIVATRRQIANVGAVNVYQTVPQTIFNLVDGVVTFSATNFDQDSTLDLFTGTWIPKQAGKYKVTASIGYDTGTVVPNCYVALWLTRNGGAFNQSTVVQHTSSTDFIIVSVTDLIEMNGTTDYMNVVTRHNFGVDTPTWGTGFSCKFSAHKVD